ncbi:MAG: alpha/beta hydrolase [Amaricoccus sp.]|uniref:alpha/beta hydrolase n=1 Tax=Amaricoccus sp. TaxID=1872485 RepID=UPI0039E64BD5
MSEKTPILFLHGAFSGPEVWTRFVAPWFAARGHPVAAPRLSDPLSTRPARLRDYVRRAQTASDALGAPPVVIGHSLGGLVGQHLAARRRVAGLALVASPGPAGLGPSLWQLSAGAPEVIGALMVAQAGGGAFLGVEAVRRALFTDETPDDWIRDVMQPLTQESPLVLLDGLTWDLPPWFLMRRIPVLGLLGDRDAFVPVTDLWSTALAYRAETEVLRGFGHGLPLDPHWKSLAWRLNAWIDERRIGVTDRQHSAVR